MSSVKLQIIDKSDKATLYSICFNDENLTEFEKFLTKFRDNAELKKDYQIIVFAIRQILERGVFERYFRTEGKISDNVCALPITSGKLRLYCIRLSDKILIAGNGGIKNTATYNESEELNGYVMDLQKFDRIIKVALKRGTITIEEAEICGIDNKTFEV